MFATVEMVLPNGDVAQATTLDVGLTGIAIWATGSRPSGPVRLRLPLEDGLPPLEVDGQIAREFRSDGGAVWGIEFQDLGTLALERLQRYAQTHTA